MKNKTLKLVSFLVAIVCCLLVFLAAVIPFLKVTTVTSTTSSTTNIYFHQLFSASISTSTSSSISAVSFGSIVVLILFLVAPLAVISEKKIIKALGLCADLSMLSVAVYLLDLLKELKASIGTSSTTKVTSPGLIILLVAAIVVVLFSIIDLVVAFFGEKIANALKSSTKSTKELLDENEELFKAGYINEAERDSRKARILEGK